MTRRLRIVLLLITALAVVASSASPGSPRARTSIAVQRGAVVVRTSVESRRIIAGDTATIAGARIYGSHPLPAPLRPRQTWLAVLDGAVFAWPIPATTPPSVTVPAGYEALFGTDGPRLGPIDPARVRLARLLAQRTSPGDPQGSLSATVRAALSRLNAIAAERLRRRDAPGLRGLAVADCKVGARPLVALIRDLDQLAALTRTVDVAYNVTDWRANGDDRALARYAATIALSPFGVEELRAEIALAGTVSYRRLGGSWRFENFGIRHASVDTRKLPVAFDRINDLLVPSTE